MPSHMPNIVEMLAPQALSQLIDHTKLTFSSLEQSDEQKRDAITLLCQEAVHHHFKAVCVRSAYVALASQQLRGTGVLTATVIGFPEHKVSLEAQKLQPDIGNVPLGQKLAEVEQALQDGCDEFDLVMNVGQFLNADAGHTLDEFKVIRNACKGKCLKVIIETDLLTPEQIKRASLLCAEADADFVKTSTGMVDGGEGGKASIIAIIHDVLTGFCHSRQRTYDFGIKASGGIKTLQQLVDAVREGATRIGTSNAVQIYNESSHQNKT